MALLRKTTFNFLLEGVSLLILMSLIATGLVMHFTLPPGSGERLVQWELSRHDWGAVHFWIAMALIGLMLLHLVLHWRWIWAIAKGQNPKMQMMRGIVFLLVTILLLVFALLPWLVPVRPGAGARGRGGFDAPGGRGFRGGRGQSMEFRSRNIPNDSEMNPSSVVRLTLLYIIIRGPRALFRE